jgi:hypothetical protein
MSSKLVYTLLVAAVLIASCEMLALTNQLPLLTHMYTNTGELEPDEASAGTDATRRN